MSFFTLIYSVVITLFTAVLTPQIRADVVACGKSIANAFVTAKNWIISVAVWASKLGDKIQQPTVASIVHWILYVLVILIIVGETIRRVVPVNLVLITMIVFMGYSGVRAMTKGYP